MQIKDLIAIDYFSLIFASKLCSCVIYKDWGKCDLYLCVMFIYLNVEKCVILKYVAHD